MLEQSCRVCLASGAALNIGLDRLFNCSWTELIHSTCEDGGEDLSTTLKDSNTIAIL